VLFYVFKKIRKGGDLVVLNCVQCSITSQLLNHLNYSGFPLWRRVEHLVR